MNYFYFDQKIQYPQVPPYYPEKKYLEYPYDDIDNMKLISREDQLGANDIYEAIRNTMICAEMDNEHINTDKWNPLGKFIMPGDTVLLKPNLVNHLNPAEKDRKRGMECLITHPSIVRCLFDYVYIALKGRGRIIIADAPIQGCDFASLLDSTGYGKLFGYCKEKGNPELEIITADLRELVYRKVDGIGVQAIRDKVEFPGVVVDLKDDSYFWDIKTTDKLRITTYDGKDTVTSHKGGHNLYKISSAVLEADVVISIPKPKSHRIAGYTAALKNMIGVNARKEYLPHHQIGSRKSGGDEYMNSHNLLKFINSRSNDLMNKAMNKKYYRIERLLNLIGRKTGRLLDKYEPDRFKFGMWYGNDTIWRTILDLNHIVLYADKSGQMQKKIQRRIIHFGDMIVCGDHEGPLNPTYKRVGGILFSDNAVEFDRIAVKLMGFDWKLLPVLRNAVRDKRLFDEDNNCLSIDSNQSLFRGNVDNIEYLFDFVPTLGWKDQLK